MKFYDARTGRYRFRYKGTGVVRETLMAIGKQLQKAAAKAAAPTLKKAAAKATEMGAQVLAEKGGKKIRQLLQSRAAKRKNPKGCPQQTPRTRWSKSARFWQTKFKISSSEEGQPATAGKFFWCVYSDVQVTSLA